MLGPFRSQATSANTLFRNHLVSLPIDSFLKPKWKRPRPIRDDEENVGFRNLPPYNLALRTDRNTDVWGNAVILPVGRFEMQAIFTCGFRVVRSIRDVCTTAEHLHKAAIDRHICVIHLDQPRIGDDE